MQQNGTVNNPPNRHDPPGPQHKVSIACRWADSPICRLTAFPVKLIVVLISLAGGLFLGGCEERKQAAPPPVPEVAVVTVQPQRVELTTELPGRTAAYLVAEIRPQVSGLIQKRLFKEGSDVKGGQILYQIDPAPFQATLDNARAALGKAEANRPAIQLRMQRYKELLADKAVSQQDYDDAAAALKQAEAEVELWKAAVETARISLGYTRVTAPISGRIGRSSVTDGALVTAHQPVALATIQQLDPIYADVPQSTSELLRLRRRLEEGQLDQNGRNQQKVKLILQDDEVYPWKERSSFATSPWTPPRGRSSCGLSFPIPTACCCRGCSYGQWCERALTSRPFSFPSRPCRVIPRGIPRCWSWTAKGRSSSGRSGSIGPLAINGWWHRVLRLASG